MISVLLPFIRQRMPTVIWYTKGQRPALRIPAVPEGGSRGKAFLRIPVGGDQTPTLYFDYYEPIVRREGRPLAASRGWIRVEKGAAYTLSCDMRASVDGTPALLGVQSEDPAGGSNEWGCPPVSSKVPQDWGI